MNPLRHRRRGLWNLVAAAVAAAVLLGMVSTPAQATRRLGPDNFGRLFLSVLDENGTTTTPFVRVPGTGDNITAGAGAGIHRQLHVVFSDKTGALFYTVRKADGIWVPIVNLATMTGDPGDVIALTAANVGNLLHVVVATESGAIFHTIRFDDGTWQRFGNVAGETGDPGDVEDVTATDVNGDLHVVMATDNGAVFHAIRFRTGTWTRITNVGAAAGDPGDIRSVATVGFGSELFVQEVEEFGGTFFTVRRADGTWTRIENIQSRARIRGLLDTTGAAGIGSNYYLVHDGIEGLPQTDVLSLTIRRPDGTFTTRELDQPLDGSVQSIGVTNVKREVNLLVVA